MTKVKERSKKIVYFLNTDNITLNILRTPFLLPGMSANGFKKGIDAVRKRDESVPCECNPVFRGRPVDGPGTMNIFSRIFLFYFSRVVCKRPFLGCVEFLERRECF
jgi:hypothetical protein